VAGALITLLVLVALLAGGSLWFYAGAGPKARSGSQTAVVLRHGAGLSEIGADLQQAGVIRPPGTCALVNTLSRRALRCAR
jgi:UPF0755 protein